MGTSRLEAFSDGVLAVIITIMVLELKVPHGAELAALLPLAPVFLAYILSFHSIGTYWNNHHYLLHATEHITPAIMWANLHLLFWLSLIPFSTAWLGENHTKSWPTAFYGTILFMSAIAYTILLRAILAHQGKNSPLAQRVGKDWKGNFSLACYALAIPAAFLNPYIADAFFVVVAAIWFIPDPRLKNIS